jgi:hypothetical protein
MWLWPPRAGILFFSAEITISGEDEIRDLFYQKPFPEKGGINSLLFF